MGVDIPESFSGATRWIRLSAGLIIVRGLGRSSGQRERVRLESMTSDLANPGRYPTARLIVSVGACLPSADGVWMPDRGRGLRGSEEMREIRARERRTVEENEIR